MRSETAFEKSINYLISARHNYRRYVIASSGFQDLFRMNSQKSLSTWEVFCAKTGFPAQRSFRSSIKLTSLNVFYMGQLRTLSNQMGYPVGVIVRVIIKIND